MYILYIHIYIIYIYIYIIHICVIYPYIYIPTYMEVSLQWPWGKLTVHESCEIPVDLAGSSTIDNLTITNKQLVGG